MPIAKKQWHCFKCQKPITIGQEYVELIPGKRHTGKDFCGKRIVISKDAKPDLSESE